VRDGDALWVTLAHPNGQTVVVSYFDEDGRFVSADLRPAAASLTFPLVGAHTARVMLLDAAYKPLCAPVPVALTKFSRNSRASPVQRGRLFRGKRI
ncbi:MAG: hypothetical protein IJQ25_05525, partial [Oscillibacter sp.]|nr:hypothetical protein [Oscillibacter sp.]